MKIQKMQILDVCMQTFPYVQRSAKTLFSLHIAVEEVMMMCVLWVCLCVGVDVCECKRLDREKETAWMSMTEQKVSL